MLFHAIKRLVMTPKVSHCILWLLISTLSCVQIPWAQSPSVTKIGVESGLTQGYVSGIAQDKHGFLWIATLGGLNRFDGENLITFQQSSFGNSGPSSNSIKNVFCDSKDQIWLVLSNGGLDVYSKKSKHFHSIENILDLKGQRVIGFLELEKEYYAAVTQKEIIKFSYGLEYDVKTSEWKPKLIGDVVRCGHSFHDYSHFFKVNNDEILVGSDLTVHLCNKSFEPKKSFHLINRLAPGQAITKYYWNGQEVIVLIDENNDVLVYNPIQSDIQYVDAIELNIPRPNFLEINCVFNDSSGRWWVGTGGEGLYTQSSSTLSISTVQHPDKYFLSVYDREPLGKDKLIFFAYKRFLLFDLIENKFLPNDDFPFYKIEGSVLRIDCLNRKWINSDKGIHVYNDDLFCISNVYERKEREANINALSISGCDVLFATSHGMYIYSAESLKRKSFFPFPKGFGDKEGIIFHSIIPRPFGYILLTSDGVYKYDVASNQWSFYRVGEYEIKEEVFTVVEDKDNPDVIWLGMSGSGLVKYNEKSKDMKRYTTNDGVSGNIIYGMVWSSDSSLWLSTNNGLTRVNVQNESIHRYYLPEDELSQEFNRFSCFTPDGEVLYFGGVSGVSILKASDARSKRLTLKLSIESINVSKDTKVQYDGASKDFNDVVSLEASEQSSFVQIRVVAPDCGGLDKLLYRYKMSGLNELWSEPNSTGEFTFSKLSPGSYELVIAVSRGDGVWIEYPRSLRITVAPLWYRTNWFYLLVFLLFLGLLLIFYRIRISRISEQQAIKDALARDLHDDIGSSLSSIAIYTEVAMQQKHDPQRLDSVLNRILKTSTQTQEMMSQIIRTLKYSELSLAVFSSQLQGLLSSWTDQTSLKYRFEIEGALSLKLSAMEIRHLTMIAKEAVNNILKHSKATEVLFRIAQTGNSILFSIEDNGIGISENIHSSGNGLRNMRDRASLMDADFTVKKGENGGCTLQIILKK